MRRKAIAIGWALATVWLTLLSPVMAQTAASGRVTGVVVDALGRPIEGSELRLQGPDGRELARATSDAQGRFSFPPMPSGTYAVTADKADFQTATVIAAAASGAPAELKIALTATKPLDLALAAKQLENARLAIEPRIGASTYAISQQAIRSQPAGENNSLNQVLLQAPGVSQDSLASGSLHIRNEHANLQYRIDGVILPEGVSFFGQSLSPRFVNSVDLITGALPAQYGLRTAGIVDLQTKSGSFDKGGYAGIYGGSHDALQPSVEYGGSVGRLSYYVAGDYLENSLGIENPTSSYNAIHDNTQQGHGFAYFSGIIDPTSRIAAILGTFRGQFQIPNIPGQTPSNSVNGSADFDSARLNENQRELNHYAIFSYLKSAEKSDFQVSGFSRYSSLTFRPDPLGDLAFNGIAQDAYRRSLANGIQTDSSHKIFDDHTLRAGFVITGERVVSQTNSLVEAAAGPDTPFTISDNSAKTGWTYSLYLQDEWRLAPRLTVNYGGRFDVVNAFTNENQISPRLNVVLQATETTTLHAGYAKYFTPPPLEFISTTSVSKLAGTTGAPPGTTNDPVRAERADLFDLGVSQQVMPGLKTGIDAYYKHSHNLIDEGQFGAPIILTAFNYRTARNLGVEFTTSYEADGLSLYGNLAVAQQKAKDIVSAQFNFTPDDLAFIRDNAIHTDHDQLITASAGASYLWKDTRFSADLISGSGLRAGGDHPNGHALPSYEQINLGVSQHLDAPTVGALDVRFDIFNLFDEIYKIRDGTGVGVGAPQFGPRRAFFAGVKKAF
jgi:outer membrane receptor protein involved in Fe transport